MTLTNRSQQRLLILLGLLVTLGFIWGFKNITAHIAQPIPANLIQNMKSEEVNLIEINDGRTILVLRKKDGLWFQSGAGIQIPADQPHVSTLITNIFSLKRDTLVSTNKSRFNELGVDSQNITLKTDKQTNVLYVGTSSNPDSSYARLKDDTTVYSVENLTDVFTPLDYRDLNTHIIDDQAKVSSATISYLATNLELKKTINDWFIDSIKIKTQAVDYFINDLKSLKAEDIHNHIPDEDSSEKALEIVVNEEGKNKTVTFYKKNDIRYYMTTSYSPFTYEISSTYVESLKKTDKDFE